MNCCSASASCAGTARFFGRSARRYAKRFRSRGLDPAQRALADALTDVGIDGATLLEVGCGVGGLHLSLLQRGARSALGVDVSEGMIAEARELADGLGLRSQTEHRVGDIVALAPAPAPADAVILDKVVCCYADWESLLAATLASARRTYAISHPRDRLIVRAGFRTLMMLGRLLGWSFTPSWHDWERIGQEIERAGFREERHASTFAWSIRVYVRERAAAQEAQ